MADITITKQVVSGTAEADYLVYTVPTGKTAEILYCSIANTATPLADVEFTLRWRDASEGAGGTLYEFLVAARLPRLARLVPFTDGLVFHAGDKLEVPIITSSARLDVVLSVNETP